MNLFDLESTLQEFKKKNVDLKVIKQLKAGKEAQGYLVECDRKLTFLKVYKNYALRSFKNTDVYTVGRYIKRPSHRKSVTQKNKFGKIFIQNTWVMREFYLLKKIFNKRGNIPEPFLSAHNAILMEYIGNKVTPAPKLKDVELTKKQAKECFKTVIENIRIFLDIGIVHSDLSPYNILYWKGKPYIIDFPQAIDIRNSPNRELFLKREIGNISNYFEKYLEINKKAVLQSVTKQE